MSALAMNADDRNVSGSSRNVLMPMMDSRWRTSMPIVLEKALKTVPSSTEATISRAVPPTPPG
jgi:hypothetical protein